MITNISSFYVNKIGLSNTVQPKPSQKMSNDVFVKSNPQVTFAGKERFSPEKTQATLNEGLKIEYEAAQKAEKFYKEAYNRLVEHIESKAEINSFDDEEQVELFEALNEITHNYGNNLLLQERNEEAIKITKQSFNLFKELSGLSENSETYLQAKNMLNELEQSEMERQKYELDREEMIIEDEIDDLTAIPAESISKNPEVVKAYQIAYKRNEDPEYRMVAIDIIEESGEFNVLETLAMANMDPYMNSITLEALKSHKYKPEVAKIISNIAQNHEDEETKKVAKSILASNKSTQKPSNI